MPNAYKVVKYRDLDEPVKVRQCIYLSDEGNAIGFEEIDAIGIVEVNEVVCYLHHNKNGKLLRLTEPTTGASVGMDQDREKGFKTIADLMLHVDNLVFNSKCRTKYAMEKRVSDTMKLRENALKINSLTIPLHVLSLLVWGD